MSEANLATLLALYILRKPSNYSAPFPVILNYNVLIIKGYLAGNTYLDLLAIFCTFVSSSHA